MIDEPVWYRVAPEVPTPNFYDSFCKAIFLDRIPMDPSTIPRYLTEYLGPLYS